ncbi:MAG: 3-oxoacyl-ACP synthase [Flavobacteriaceae bacterium]
MTLPEIKEALYQVCFEKVDNRYQKIKQTIADIDESLLEEDKSSAGDKHETGRAMLQIDRENASKQMQEVVLVQELLKKMDIKSTSDYVRLGSLVKTDKYMYFISLSIGPIEINEIPYVCIALNSPIGQTLAGKRKGDSIVFNDTNQKILAIY